MVRDSFESIAGALWLYTSKLHLSPQTTVAYSLDADVELDEISFRSTGRAHGIVWLRHLAVAWRGSSLVWLQRLDYRITRKGQGGGGPISVDEMWSALLLDSDQPVLAEGASAILTVRRLIAGFPIH